MSRFVPEGTEPFLRPAVRAGDWLAISGQVGHVDFTLVPGGIEEQFRQAMSNFRDAVTQHGGTMSDVVKVNVYLADIDDFWPISEIYRDYIDPESLPARTAIAASQLPFGALVEVEGWAHLPK